MEAICAALRTARSNVYLQALRADDWVDGRTARAHDPVANMMLVDAVHDEIVSLLTEGYRRAGAFVKGTPFP